MRSVFPFLSFVFMVLITCSVAASELVLIKTNDINETRRLFENPHLVIHYHDDVMVIATNHAEPEEGFHVLDTEPWRPGYGYYLVFVDRHTDKQTYIADIEPYADLLYDAGHCLVVGVAEHRHRQFTTVRNDGIIRIFEREARLAAERLFERVSRTEPDPFVQYLIDQVDGELLTDRVQHLEDYGTRNAYAPESILAQQWIESQFLGWGLDVETMAFFMPGGPSSDNVIATLTGTKHPDEYVIVGGHYDSISWSGLAPGADDNASGTSGVMEAARILSNYEFDRSIIFIAFSGEEYGLYGSAAYAQQAAQDGKEILGYINMDMIGYLKPGHTTIMTSLIYPASAAPLADFYTDVTALYLPDFVVQHTSLPSGYNSDHTSFNNNGFMGIFPFEDVNNFSPYIHTANDIVGLSYNNEEQAVIFTKAAIASVVTMANMDTDDEPVFTVSFDITNGHGDTFENAVITFDGHQADPGTYIFEDVEPGDYPFQVTNTCYAIYEGVISVVGDNVEEEVLLQGIPGDANGDGIVNVLDVISIANKFIDQEPDPFCFYNADVNGDWIINVLDVMGTVAIFDEPESP